MGENDGKSNVAAEIQAMLDAAANNFGEPPAAAEPAAPAKAGPGMELVPEVTPPKEKGDEPAPAPAKKEEPAKAGEEPTEADTVSSLRSQLETMAARIQELSAGKAVPAQAPATPAPGAQEPTPAPQPATPQFQLAQGQVIDFVGEADLDDVLNSKEALNALLNKAMAFGRQSAVEASLMAMPQVVASNVKQQVLMQTKAQEFYAENKDLRPFSNAVAIVAEELGNANPTWGVDKLYAETETEVRKRLALAKAAVSKPTPEDPGFATRTNSPRSKPTQEQVNSLQADIDKTNRALGIY